MRRYFLGDPSSAKIWIFLCGLNDDFDGPKAQNSRVILDKLGRKLGLTFLALEPPARCPDFGNQICWPLGTPDETLKTFMSIQEHTKDLTPHGYMGFSNGGFFLCALAQLVALDVPLIAIASGGKVTGTPAANRLILMAGDTDRPYIRKAQDMEASARGTSLNVTLHTFSGGHILPEALLETELSRL
jgi:hypothetical protein